MKNTKSVITKINEISSNGYQLDFGAVFESAFENYKNFFWYAGLMLIVYSIVLTIIGMTGLIWYIGIENLEDFGNKMKQIGSLKVMPLEVAIPLNAILLLFSALVNPFMAGFLKMAHCGENDEEFHVSTMFSYYKSPYFTNIFMAAIIIGCTGTGMGMLLESAGLSFVGTVITLLISFITFLTIPLIVFGKLNAVEAIKSSIIIVSKQPLTLLGLLVVAGIGTMLGLFGLCIGLFFTYPFLYSMYYVIYKSIIGIDETSEIDEISGN